MRERTDGKTPFTVASCSSASRASCNAIVSSRLPCSSSGVGWRVRPSTRRHSRISSQGTLQVQVVGLPTGRPRMPWASRIRPHRTQTRTRRSDDLGDATIHRAVIRRTSSGYCTRAQVAHKAWPDGICTYSAPARHRPPTSPDDRRPSHARVTRTTLLQRSAKSWGIAAPRSRGARPPLGACAPQRRQDRGTPKRAFAIPHGKQTPRSL